MKASTLNLLYVAVLVLVLVTLGGGQRQMAGEDVIYELAARLGSPVTFDRHGWVVWMDDFEHGIIKWDSYTPGTGAAVEVGTTRARSGGQSAKLTCGTAIGYECDIYTLLPYPALAYYGLEASFTLNEYHTEAYLALYFYDGTTLRQASVKYDMETDTVKYFGDDAAYHDLTPTVRTLKDDLLFNTMKIVVDPAEGEYVRAILNHQVFDMKGLKVWTMASGSEPYIAVYVGFNGQSPGAAISYVDDVIVTQNEP